MQVLSAGKDFRATLETPGDERRQHAAPFIFIQHDFGRSSRQVAKSSPAGWTYRRSPVRQAGPTEEVQPGRLDLLNAGLESAAFNDTLLEFFHNFCQDRSVFGFHHMRDATRW